MVNESLQGLDRCVACRALPRAITHSLAFTTTFVCVLVGATGGAPTSRPSTLEGALPGLRCAALHLLVTALRVGGQAAVPYHAQAARLIAGQLGRLPYAGATESCTV